MPISLQTRPQSVSLSRASCTVSLCFEVLSYPSLPSGAVRCSRSLCAYSSILREIATRYLSSASRPEVASRKRAANAIQSRLHACCQVETRRDATLVEMRREVRAVCDRSAGNCYINPSEPCYIVLTQRCNQNIKQRSCRICPIGFGMFCCHPILPWKVTKCCLPPKADNDTL
jgi:hypothetical protein